MAAHSEDETFIRRLLTPAEQERVDAAGFVIDASQDRSPEQLFKNWRHLVEEVERPGYGWEPEEFMHSLWFRDDLEDVIGMIAPERQELIREAVRPWDLRFDAATDNLREPICGKPPQRWWTYRAPRDADPEFIESAGKLLQYES